MEISPSLSASKICAADHQVFFRQTCFFLRYLLGELVRYKTNIDLQFGRKMLRNSRQVLHHAAFRSQLSANVKLELW